MTLSVFARHRLGAFDLDVSFESGGTLTAIFGASGSGKTTLVNVIAGLIRPDEGLVRVDDHVLVDTSRRICLPPHRRRIGYVFQDARLFPHLTVEQNLAYGHYFAPRRERYADRDRIISLLGISHLLARKPARLSGGEKQRVAVGRALLASPRLLLMDEPLASLDQGRKEEILPYIADMRDTMGIPIVYVSHSIAEVARLASHVAVMAGGRVTAFGPTTDVLNRLDNVPSEETDEHGTLIDMTVVSYDPSFRMTRLSGAAGDAWVPGQAGDAGRSVRVRIRARDVILATEKPQHISALNVFRGTVTSIAEADEIALYVNIDCGGDPIVARITRQSCAALAITPGTSVHVIVKALALTGAGMTPRTAAG